MASLFRRYAEAVRDCFGKGYWGTWHPGVRLSLGDVCTNSHGAPLPIDNISRHGVAFTPAPVTARDDVTYKSDDSIDVRIKAAGAADLLFTALPQAEAGAAVTFGPRGGVLLHLADVAEERIAALPPLATHVLTEWRAGRWSPDHLIVTHLLVAGSGTILGSTSKDSRAELRLKASIPTSTPVNVAAGGGFEIVHSESLGVEAVGEGLTPVARVLGLKRTWLRRMKVVYGTVQPFRTGQLDDAAFADLLDEAAEEPEVVLGTEDQLEYVVESD